MNINSLIPVSVARSTKKDEQIVQKKCPQGLTNSWSLEKLTLYKSST